jgi:hypothetical protein
MGSCFTENIGNKFSELKFNTLVNPFGQQYNPASIANGINRIVQQQWFEDDDVIYQDELFHSWQHHSDFSKSTKDELLTSINTTLKETNDWFKNVDYLMLTFGTSHIYEWKKDGRIVSNCHKISGSEFDLRFLSPEETFERINKSLNALKQINPSVKIFLTISPVRYLAFGFYENNLSKANLFVAIEKLLKTRTDCFYFPAYEIVMDELRDYRFFTEDLLHPTRLASQIVWEKLCDSLMNSETKKMNGEIVKVLAAVAHKPRNPNSQAQEKFKKITLDKIKLLQSKLPNTTWKAELMKMDSQ